MIKVIKKDGTKEEFNVQKVVVAVNKSAYRALVTFTEVQNLTADFYIVSISYLHLLRTLPKMSPTLMVFLFQNHSVPCRNPHTNNEPILSFH